MLSLPKQRLVPALFALAASAPAFAQGGDDCSNATAIAGFGTFPVTTVAATDSAQQSGIAACGVAHRDVWFAWTASQTGFVSVATCGGTTADTVVAAYNTSGCPTPAQLLACNDDGCGNQSTVGFNAVSGTTYAIQVGAFFTSTTFTGSISIGASSPPPPCGGNTGPDVIVGALTDVMNVVAVGGIDAVAIGTTSCNVGTSVLIWQASTPNHPVIRENVYRYKVVNGAGRFEQLGMTWLKHAFAAAAGNLCCTCTGGGGGLGIGCSDTYGSGLNGGQSGAGPNWQVNAHTGVFPYPPANPAWSGVIARRCQMPVADLEVTGLPGAALFYGEAHYVTADDAAAGNQNNNVSWCAMSCAGGPSDYTMALSGTTNRGDPAIRAWAAAEGGVTLSDVQIPNDGLVVVGSKATDLGGGTWHYEYAVYNMNADRNVGSFSVPLTLGTTVSNVGFHDVAHHDGDGIGNVNASSLDWAVTVSGSAITWACDAELIDANANAIRWGTLYNFRFDADAPPTAGTLTLAPWKGGSPATVAANGDVPGNTSITTFCAGDGTTVACPCGNNGNPGRGCGNSLVGAGAELIGFGQASVSGDSASIAASSMTGTTCTFFQGDASMAPIVVDDGLGCVTGNLVRLATRGLTGGACSIPQVGDPSLSVNGSVPPAGATIYYQCVYRNSAASFCPPSSSNRTNGVKIIWAP